MCGLISLDQFRLKESDRKDPNFRSFLCGRSFLLYQECVEEAKKLTGLKGDVYAPIYGIFEEIY